VVVIIIAIVILTACSNVVVELNKHEMKIYDAIMDNVPTHTLSIKEDLLKMGAMCIDLSLYSLNQNTIWDSCQVRLGERKRKVRIKGQRLAYIP
jgi:hypothetical protein